jgi:predicted small lipoprotein YifL
LARRAGGPDVVTKSRQISGIALARLGALALLGLLALGGCGQKGPLYLPDQAGEIVTRPTQTPAPSENSEAPPLPQAESSPQTVDSPETGASPAPEVVAPAPASEPTEADKKKQDPAQPR